MKALGLILLAARADGSEGLASLWLIGIVIGVITGFIGLARNHRDHTRR